MKDCKLVTIISFLILIIFTSPIFASVIVNTSRGKVRGFETNSILNGTKYYSFLGIPYAKPPIKNLRFQPPIPVEKWEGILNKTKVENVCPQIKITHNRVSVTGDEDCLYLNIYTPQPPVEIKIPKAVMVWFHGGGFQFGAVSQQFGSPDYLINYDVILVTFHYRLHALGFLNLGIQNASGNYGLKDQLLALKWIQQNIREFGGDPKKVTIFGLSAGGASVQFQTLSPLSKGLFQRAIVQSAHVLSQWTFNPKPVEWGFLLANLLGFEGKDSEDVVDFLKKQPADSITYAVHKLQQRHANEYHQPAFLIFVPSVEIIKENAFLPDIPENLIKIVENIPLMIGFVEHEGDLELSEPRNKSETGKDFISIIKYSFDGIDESRLDYIASKVKKFYIGDKEIVADMRLELLKIWDDIAILRFYETIEKLSDSSSPPYVYKFVYEGSLHWKKLTSSKLKEINIQGPTHADEIFYLFYLPSMFSTIPSVKPNDLQVIHRICSLWTNFAKTGDPTYNMDVKWRPSTNNKPAYLEISLDLKLVEGKICERGNSFWVELFKSESLPIRNSEYLYNISKFNEKILTNPITR